MCIRWICGKACGYLTGGLIMCGPLGGTKTCEVVAVIAHAVSRLSLLSAQVHQRRWEVFLSLLVVIAWWSSQCSLFLLPYSAPEVCEGAINMWFCSWIVYTYDFIVNNNSTVLHMLFIRVWFMFVQGRVCVSVQCFSSNMWHQRDWCGEPSGLFIVDRWHLSQPVSRDRASQLANQQLSFVFSLSFYCRERWSDGGSKRLTHCYLWI